jgi:hypothetical protein
MCVRFFSAQVIELATHAGVKIKDEIYALARDAMHQAQDMWIPKLAIPMPDFLSVNWRDLDVAELEKLVALAESYKYNGNHAHARNAMLQAQDFWRPELGVSWPNFSAGSEAWRELDLEQLEQMNFLAEQNARFVGECGLFCGVGYRRRHRVEDMLCVYSDLYVHQKLRNVVALGQSSQLHLPL